MTLNEFLYGDTVAIRDVRGHWIVATVERASGDPGGFLSSMVLNESAKICIKNAYVDRVSVLEGWEKASTK